ncbi:hypothetical protein PCL71_07510 [Staphylococcus aureus]|nr:hypothetical protein [Staphylococcus aureus]WIY92685.1 hypothetical protein PCM14_07490 [Staphylococcus aureus]WJA66815.1 hypothetical protein PCL71_07510 [Staphylococcus aureus]CAC6862364.1 Uncharacterised protein [Staphylococcus aureus]CAC7692927.1 Uncharacterised protein [Staphylococcus aureus]CAC7695728.1 Uncharacterised protein [Staphylococcus aureus]
MNNINDRDLTELSGYWVYQDIKDGSKFRVNDKKFKQVEEITKVANKNNSSDIKVYELLDENETPTGKQVLLFQGVNSGLKMLFYGGLKMSFFSGLRLSYI